MKLFAFLLSLVCVVNANYDITDIAKRTALQIGALSKGDGVEVDDVVVKNSGGGSTAEVSNVFLLFDASFDFIPHECEAEVELLPNGMLKLVPEKCACHPIIMTDPLANFMTDEEMEKLFGDESDAFDIGSDEEKDEEDQDDEDDDESDGDEATGDEETEQDYEFDMDDLADDEAETDEEDASDQDDDGDEEVDPEMGEEEKRDDVQMDAGALKQDDNCLSAAKLALQMIPNTKNAAEEMMHKMEAQMGMDYKEPKAVNYKLKSIIECKVKGNKFEMKLETQDGSFCNIVLNAPNMNSKGATLPQNQCQKQN